MTIVVRDLRVFVEVLQVGGFTRAANRLHYVQSTVSQAVLRLESEFGLQLIERRPGGVKPTPAGDVLFRHAQAILNSIDRAESDMDAFRRLSKGRVTLGVLPTVTPILAKNLLSMVQAEHPGLETYLEEVSAIDMLEKLRTGYLELGIGFLPIEADDLVVEELTTQRLAVIVSAGHRLSDRESVDPSELAQERWITYRPSHPGRIWLERLSASAPFIPTIVAEIDTPAQVRSYVEAGLGVALAPSRAFERDRQLGALQVVSLTSPQPTCTIACVYDPYHVSAALTFVRTAIDEVLGPYRAEDGSRPCAESGAQV